MKCTHCNKSEIFKRLVTWRKGFEEELYQCTICDTTYTIDQLKHGGKVSKKI